MVIATSKKRYDAAHARVLTVTVLLEEEQCTTTILTEEAHSTVVLIEPPSPTPPPAPSGGAALSNDDYEAIVIANVHIQATGVQDIHLGHAGPLLHTRRPVA
jgi:hypothetical protein